MERRSDPTAESLRVAVSLGPGVALPQDLSMFRQRVAMAVPLQFVRDTATGDITAAAGIPHILPLGMQRLGVPVTLGELRLGRQSALG